MKTKPKVIKDNSLLRSSENSGSVELVQIDEDIRVASMKAILEIRSALDFLNEGIKTNNLMVSTRHNTIGVTKSHLTRLAGLLNAEEDDKQNEELKQNLLRQVNMENHRLREEMAKGVSIEGIGMKLYLIEKAVYYWWQNLGFTYSKQQIHSGPKGASLRCEFSVNLERHISSHQAETKPVTARAKRRAKIEAVSHELQITQDQSEFYVVDTPNNRAWLTQKLQNKYPSVKIHGWESHSIYRSDEFQISKIDASIDISDINPDDEDSKYKEDE